MRKAADKNGVSLKAYAGTTGILLGINIDSVKRAGLLGFALERLDSLSGKKEWLNGMLPFPHMKRRPGELLPTNVAPIQKFRWSDYRVFPGTKYEYTVHLVCGDPQNPDIEAGPTIAVTTVGTQGEHCILFNRAAAASQAFSRKFPNVEEQIENARKAKLPLPPLPPEALDWLSRGVLEQIVQFIEQASDNTWALDIAIYEYELQDIVQAVEAAHARGVSVRVVYHAKARDPQTAENEHNLASLPALLKQGRLTNSICHHKFILLSKVVGGNFNPEAVLCGSTNFTHNGVYRQANVVHVVRRADVAQKYLKLFEVLFKGNDQAATRGYLNENNPFSDPLPDLFVGFSPRSDRTDLDRFVSAVKDAKQDVLFCTAFNLDDEIENALLGLPNDPILRYGLENSRGRITGFHADRQADFTATAMLSRGLEGFLKESTKGQKGNILIHTKLILIDFTSDSPTVISGSHNFSNNASKNNDENFLVLHGNTDIADCYGCELMRLYDHYRFRFRVKNDSNSQQPLLKPDDTWTKPYFEPATPLEELKKTDRLRFSGKTD